MTRKSTELRKPQKPRKLSEAQKKLVAGNQRFKCNNSPGSNLAGLGNYECPLWVDGGQHAGCFDKSGYAIDHIDEWILTNDDSPENLQALCLSCHRVKTSNFMMNRPAVLTDPNTNLIDIKTPKINATKHDINFMMDRFAISTNYETNLINIETPKINTMKHDINFMMDRFAISSDSETNLIDIETPKINTMKHDDDKYEDNGCSMQSVMPLPQIPTDQVTNKNNKFKYNCEKCDFHVNAKSTFEKHKLTGKHLSDKRAIRSDKQLISKCEICGYVPANVNYMKVHALYAHSTVEDRTKSFPYYCMLCDYGTFFTKKYEQHLISRSHKGVIKFSKNTINQSNEDPNSQKITPIDKSNEDTNSQPITPIDQSNDDPNSQKITPIDKSNDDSNSQKITPIDKSNEDTNSQPITQIDQSNEDPNSQPITQIDQSNEDPNSQPITQIDQSNEDPIIYGNVDQSNDDPSIYDNVDLNSQKITPTDQSNDDPYISNNENKTSNDDKLTTIKTFEYNCDKCNFHVDAKSLFNKHLLTGIHLTGSRAERCDKLQRVKCEFCDHIPSNNKNMRLHILNKHSTLEERKKTFVYYCELCNCGVLSQKAYGNHIATRKHKYFAAVKSNNNNDPNNAIESSEFPE